MAKTTKTAFDFDTLTDEQKAIAIIKMEAKQKIADLRSSKKNDLLIEQLRSTIAQLQKLVANPGDVTSVMVVVRVKGKKNYTNINNI